MRHRGDKTKSNNEQTGQAAKHTANRYSSRFGWVISATIHIIIAAGFLAASVTQDAPKNKPKTTPKSSIEEQINPLEPEPLVENLQIEPAFTDEFDGPQIDELPEIADELFNDQTVDNVIAVPAGDYKANYDGATISAMGRYQSSFCGAAGRAKRICFVVDCSGSMVMAIDYVRAELKKTILALSPQQYFDVIFFAGAGPIRQPQPTLRRANSQNRQQAIKFIENTPLADVASSQAAWQAAVAAIEAAFETKTDNGEMVDLIYLLTDGQFDHQKTKDRIERLQSQRNRPAAITIIACGNSQNEQFLGKLAAANAGKYRFVSDEEMARAAP